MSADSKTFHPHGKHLIAGEWVGGGETFANSPATGESDQFQSGTPAHVDRACQAAEEAFSPPPTGAEAETELFSTETRMTEPDFRLRPPAGDTERDLDLSLRETESSQGDKLIQVINDDVTSDRPAASANE